MPLESASFISQLVPTNPVVGDDVSQGDDHIRMLKTVLQTVFPNASKAFYFPASNAEVSGNVSVLATDDGETFPVNANGAARTVDLPATPADGFSVTIVKTDASANTVTIDPAGAVEINGETTLTLTREFESITCRYLSTFAAWVGFRSVAGSPRQATEVVGIAQGGSGQITAAAAFDAFSTARADVASASPLDLDVNNSNYLRITGTTTISAITLTSGRKRWVVFEGALTLTHGASLVLPTGANITTVAGDVALFVGEAAGVVRCLHYARNDALPLAFPARAYATYTANADITTNIPSDDTIPQSSEGAEVVTAAITLKRANSRVRITFDATGQHSVGGGQWAGALFVDSAVDALAAKMATAVSDGDVAVGNVFSGIAIVHEYAPGSVGPFTYKIRVGPTAAGTLRLNGSLSARLFGGVQVATLIVQEVFVP